MQNSSYELSSVLPSLRKALRSLGSFNFSAFVTAFWPELQKIGIPGIEEADALKHIYHKYDYAQAPSELRTVTTEAFFWLFRNGFTMPEPPQDLKGGPGFHTYCVTARGAAWSKGDELLPEDVDGYMKILHTLVPNLDSIVEQYVTEGLSSFERQTYFAAAVMMGAAAEKAVYLLAESALVALKAGKRQDALRKALERRRLTDLFDELQAILQIPQTIVPYPILEGAVTHVMSLIEAIRVQRNDAVHPMNATVSPDSVRLSFQAFPHAMKKLDALQRWFLQNPHSI